MSRIVRLVTRMPFTASPQNQHYCYLITLIVLMTAVTIIIGAVTLSIIERRLITSTGETLALAAANIAETLDANLYADYEGIENTATVMGFMWPDVAAMRRYLEDRERADSGSQWTSVAVAGGHIITTTDNILLSEDDAFAAQKHRYQAQKDDIYVRESHIQKGASNIKTIAFSAPIRNHQGELLGIVTKHIALVRLEDVFAQTVRVLQMQHKHWARLEWQFLNRNGDVLIDSILRQEGKVNLKLMGLPSALLTGSTEPGYVEEVHARRLVAVVSGYAQSQGYKRFRGLHWGVLVRLDRSQILGETRSILWKFGTAEAVMFLPMLALLVWTASQLRNKWALERQEGERARAAEVALQHKEAAVRREKEFSERLINSSVDGIIAFDRECRYTMWNRGMEVISGLAAEHVIGRCAFEVFPFLKDIGEDKYFYQALEGKSVVAMDRPYYVPKTGKRGYFEAYYAPLLDGDANIEGALAVVRDVTIRKQGETALRESEERFRVIFNHAKDAIFLTDDKGSVFWANREGERLADRSLVALAGKPVTSLFTTQEDNPPAGESSMFSLAEGTHECALLRPDGTTVSVETNAASVLFSKEVSGRIVIARDITGRLRMERQLRQADKLAALGILLGGVAHELKNPLFIISGNLEIAKDLLPKEENSVIRKSFEAVEEAAHRASSIIDRFLGVMRSKKLHRRQCQVNDVITSTLELVTHSLAAHHIKVRLELSPDLPPVLSDPEGLGQVFLNLFTNACQALASVEHTRILRISTDLIATTSGLCLESRVIDNGPGIQHEHLSSIFDPFFTTKPVGQGTGLGLSISYRIMNELRGDLRCESRPGDGATFIVMLLGVNNVPAHESGQKESVEDLDGANFSN